MIRTLDSTPIKDVQTAVAKEGDVDVVAKSHLRIKVFFTGMQNQSEFKHTSHIELPSNVDRNQSLSEKVKIIEKRNLRSSVLPMRV